MAKVAIELVSSHYQVVVEFIMQLGFRARVPKAIGAEVSLGKPTHLLQSNDVKVNCLI